MSTDWDPSGEGKERREGEKKLIEKRELDDHEGDLDRANMAHCSEPSQTVGQAWGEYTHICLDKQLPCLYPFPQRSQRSSAKARFPSPLTRWDPSLARRLRFLEEAEEEVAGAAGLPAFGAVVAVVVGDVPLPVVGG